MKAGLSLAHHHDLTPSFFQQALVLASKALETLPCPVRLDECDFIEALRDRPKPTDVAWIGLSLHQLPTPAKLTLMCEMRDIVGDHGLFLIYENASPDGEDRDAWLLRWERQKPSWTEFTSEEWDAITDMSMPPIFPRPSRGGIH